MNTKITPKDFFLHLGAAVALYTVAGAFINLALSIINYATPDKLAGYFYVSSVAWPISILLVVTPILYVLEWLINRDIAKNPDRKDVWIRRWRIYLTLFLAVVLIGGDLIALLNVYFSGEITSRFVYKVLTILLVAGVVGKYYFYSIAENMRWSKMSRMVTPWFGIVMVVAAIVGGFIIVGSPAKQRAIRFDGQRVSDLSNIQWQVINRWQVKRSLPKVLPELNDSISGYSVPTDPANDSAYEYNVKGPLSFEVCATFDLAAQDTKGRGEYGGGMGGAYPVSDIGYPYPGGEMDSWKHEAGRTCFTRTIDPDVYRPIERPIGKPIPPEAY